MKRVWLFIVLVLLAACGASGVALEAESPSQEKPPQELLELGKELFTTKERLGVKYACILCHQKEKAIQRSEVIKLGDKLPDFINGQLLKQAKGQKPLAKDSQEMKALVAYILHEHSI